MDIPFFRRAQGLKLSCLGLGTYLGAMSDAVDDSYVEAIHAALHGGINVIDTSRNYRLERSERAVGRAIKGFERDEIVLCTKAGYMLDRQGHSLMPDFLENNLDHSLVNLGVDKVDVFYLHNPETQLASNNSEGFHSQIRSAFQRCEQMAVAGKLRFYGVATWDAFRTQDAVSLHRLVRIAKEIAGERHRFRFVQLPFNLAMNEAVAKRNQEDSSTLLQAAASLGLTVIGSATVYQGRLTQGLPEQLAAKFPGLTTDAQRAIQYSRSTPGITVSLVGMSKAQHVTENLGIRDVPPLTPREYAALYAR